MPEAHPLLYTDERNVLHEASLPTGREATAQQLSLAGNYDHLYESDKDTEEEEVAEEKTEKPKRKPRAKHEKADADKVADDSADEGESDDE